MSDSDRIAIIGAGTIGVGWATFFACRGYKVSCFDIDAGLRAELLSQVENNLDFLQTHNVISKAKQTEAVENCTVFASMEEAVAGASFVVEAVYETLEAKRSVFCQLDRLTPADVVLASSSSGLPMSSIQTVCNKPGRCLIAHPINPVHLIPLVELVPGNQTDPDVVADVKQFMEVAGKVPVVLAKEVPGFIENRLTAALWREAIDLVVTGVATAKDVDKAIWAGPGLRYALMGSHMIYHLGGGEGGIRYFIHHLEQAFESWWGSMRTWTKLPDNAVDILEEQLHQQLGSRSISEQCAWRDRKLVELLRVCGHLGDEE